MGVDHVAEGVALPGLQAGGEGQAERATGGGGGAIADGGGLGEGVGVVEDQGGAGALSLEKSMARKVMDSRL